MIIEIDGYDPRGSASSIIAELGTGYAYHLIKHLEREVETTSPKIRTATQARNLLLLAKMRAEECGEDWSRPSMGNSILTVSQVWMIFWKSVGDGRTPERWGKQIYRNIEREFGVYG